MRFLYLESTRNDTLRMLSQLWKDIYLMLGQHLLDEILPMLSQYGMIKAPLPVLYGIYTGLVKTKKSNIIHIQ
jgi:hypothetical protein